MKKIIIVLAMFFLMAKGASATCPCNINAVYDWTFGTECQAGQKTSIGEDCDANFCVKCGELTPLPTIMTYPPQNGKMISFMTFNIEWASEALPFGGGGDVATMLSYAAYKQVDVIALQEMQRASNDAAIAALVAQGWNYYNSGESNNSGELTLFSKYPVSGKFYDVPLVVDGSKYITFLIDTGVGVIRVINIHPSVKYATSCQFHDQMLKKINERYAGDMVILMGDFNLATAHNASCYQNYLSRFVDSCDAAVDATCADTINNLRVSGDNNDAIDHIMVDRETKGTFARPWRVVEAKVGQNVLSSDHYPVVTRLVYDNDGVQCQPCASGLARGKGNANCDNEINVLDYSIWREERIAGNGMEMRKNWQADFNCDGKVNQSDLKVWVAGFDRN